MLTTLREFTTVKCDSGDSPCLGGWSLIKINSLRNNIVIVIFCSNILQNKKVFKYCILKNKFIVKKDKRAKKRNILNPEYYILNNLYSFTIESMNRSTRLSLLPNSKESSPFKFPDSFNEIYNLNKDQDKMIRRCMR